jgi:Ca-activated chloride channel family protein
MPQTDHTPSSVQLLLTPERAALVSGRANTLRLLARVQAPDLPAELTRRDPLHLALVLDRSGSMSGAPLDEAKRCAVEIVERLAPGDRAAVIAFDDEIEQRSPLVEAGDIHALRAAIDGIEAGGTTDLHGGWRAGADELAAKLAAEGVHRVILLSDGLANRGETDLETIAGQCRDLARQGVTTSTYGLGRQFNEELMIAMAKAGRGNAYYGETAADLAEPFAAEFALLTNLCARGLVLKVHAPGECVVRVRNDYEPVAEGVRTWKLPDLPFAAEAWALVEIDVPALDASPGATIQLSVTVSIDATGRGSGPVYLMAALPPLVVVAELEFATTPVDPLVARRITELDAGDLLESVRVAVVAGDWGRADALLAEATRCFAGHEWAQAVLATMRKLVARRDEQLSAKEARFAQASMSRRLSGKDEHANPAADNAVPLYLHRKPSQGKGRTQ